LQDEENGIHTLRNVVKFLELKSNKTFEDCINLAVKLFDKTFNEDIRLLIECYPKEAKDENGEQFWIGKRRFPSAIEYDSQNELHRHFIESAAKLFARIHGIQISDQSVKNDKSMFKTTVRSRNSSYHILNDYRYCFQTVFILSNVNIEVAEC